MSEPFLAEIRMFSFDFAPRGWGLCNGQLLPISQNQALFSLLGTTYGGNGQTTFALPDLRGRMPIHAGGGHTLGERAGQESHTLILSEMPNHTHQLNALSADAATRGPAGNLPAFAQDEVYAGAGGPLAATALESTASRGGSQPHNNMQPFLTVNFCIALVGIFPSQT